MGAVKLQLRCPENVNGIGIDPNPNWSFSDLLSELNMLESKLNSSPFNPKSPNRTSFRGVSHSRREDRNAKPFIMRVSDDEMDDEDDARESSNNKLVPASRFTCSDIYLCDSESENELELQVQAPLMEKMGVVEGALVDLTNEYQLSVKDEIRSQISVLEAELLAANEKSNSALVQAKKNSEARREMDRKHDMHYQRKIAEALDNHLTAIQRDHEHKSQIEERRIRDDAALEEAKRKERALQGEKLRLQKAKEEQAREAAKRAAEERLAAQEAERRAAKEAAEKMANEQLMKTAAVTAERRKDGSKSDVPKKAEPAGSIVRAAESALKLEERRLQNLKEIDVKNQSIIATKDFRSKEREIARRIKQISGSVESVKSKSDDLVKIFMDESSCPQSVSVAMFAKKVISIYETPMANFNTSAFACGYVIVLVSAKVPIVMDILLAEFHKACIYTVPKHVMYSQSAFETKEAYFKAIGYREEDGKLETTDQFLERLGSYMKLYGAVVQTQLDSNENRHGLEAGWVWLATFLNAVPANIYTAVALEAFLRMAGYALYKRYKSQFQKILKAISKEYIQGLKARGDSRVNSVITRLEDYIDTNKFLQEPEGWKLQGSLLSRTFVPEGDRHDQYYYTSNRHFY